MSNIQIEHMSLTLFFSSSLSLLSLLYVMSGEKTYSFILNEHIPKFLTLTL